ncbi:ubiquinone biosynthesis hydrox [Punctularia strigosozonata HHB-11173 SS5]|uniref:ubiquinone biosynthesis hydrox n=1 Tax=Punctularia strigosozonata (strain HHB-11173) TaxID=741275 RepID=UPI0004417F70|nr:ubiquinone biosynthesis hydrox [Punctularia strigosozonata HHB-11173 SS5]EIN09647.1 ubiquinone biosynthesis hydrox [Punctularia strigosozonata HHB-11173 SS5]
MQRAARLSTRGLALRRRTVLSCRCASTSTSAPHEECDVVIVGGGPAGLALATALGTSDVVRASHKVVLVEAGSLSKIREWTMGPSEFSNRVSSITNASKSLLERIGAWSLVDTTRTMPIEAMQVWDGLSDARITFDAAEAGLSPLGGMATLVENLNIQRALLHRLAQTPAVELADGVRVERISPDDIEGGGWPVVHLSDGRRLRARLLVGADGFNSPVRAYARITSTGWAYPTHAVVATLRHPPLSPFRRPPTNSTAYQRFLPTGPVAFLPLSDTAASLVWSTTPALAQALKALDGDGFASMVNAAFRLPERSMRYLHARLLEPAAPLGAEELKAEIAWREASHGVDPHSAYASASSLVTDEGIPPADAGALPPLITSVQPGTVASFPLRYNHADAYLGEGAGARTVLVGDAAHTVHPLAGQGLNLGLGDVDALARCIIAAASRGGDIGAYTALMPYARERYFENHKVMSAVDKLHKLYSTTAAPVVWARSTGLEVLNELDTLKGVVMRSAGADVTDSGQGAAWKWAMGTAADAVSGATNAVRTAEILGGALGNVAAGALRNAVLAATEKRQ